MDKGDCPRYRHCESFKAAGRLGDPATRTKPKVNRYVSYANLKKALKNAPETKVQKKRANTTNSKKTLSKLQKIDSTQVSSPRPLAQPPAAPEPPHQDNAPKTGFNYTGYLSYQTQQHAEAQQAKKSAPMCRNCLFENLTEEAPKPSVGYKIVISNIQPTVTQQDIHELFEDIGPIYSAKFLQPGVVEVMYKKIEDAQTAIRTYNNVNFDGQPMRCVIINKKASASSQNFASNGGIVPCIKRPFSRSLKCSKV